MDQHRRGRGVFVRGVDDGKCDGHRNLDCDLYPDAPAASGPLQCDLYDCAGRLHHHLPGKTYSNGSTNSTVSAGTYPIVANGCNAGTFSSWTSTIGTVLSPTEASTTVSVTANGTLAASYTPTPPVSYSVTFDTAPAGCTIDFDSRTYANGSTNSSLPAGTYPIVANACHGESFKLWTTTVGAVKSSSSASTTVNVSASGTLKATYATSGSSSPPPSSKAGSGLTSIDYAVVIGVPIAAAAIALTLILMRRRRREAAGRPPPPSTDPTVEGSPPTR